MQQLEIIVRTAAGWSDSDGQARNINGAQSQRIFVILGQPFFYTSIALKTR
jgi:hypothetical protein